MQPQPLRLSEITICNLRSIHRQTFPLNNMTALIGYNNAGKTNILMGIRWLLSPFSLDVSYFDDSNEPVEVEGHFQGISETVLSRLGEEKAKEILKKVRLIQFAESLGGVESLITYPVTQTHADVPEEIREANGITRATLRLSVGIENADDLIKDLEEALNG